MTKKVKTPLYSFANFCLKLAGLTWLENADCPNATRTWQEALDDVAELNASGTMNRPGSGGDCAHHPEFIEGRLRANHLFRHSEIQNSTENFQCLWLELVEPDRDPGGLGEAGTAETVGHAEGRTVVKNLGVILYFKSKGAVRRPEKNTAKDLGIVPQGEIIRSNGPRICSLR